MMEIAKKLKVLQMFYAGALADAVLRMGNEGILEKVTTQKKIEQLANGKFRAQQLGIQTTQQVFEVLPEIFECADWKVEPTENGFYSEATNCTLCAMAKKMGAKSPCNIYCLDAMEGLVKGINPQTDFNTESTLWDSDCCKVVVKNQIG